MNYWTINWYTLKYMNIYECLHIKDQVTVCGTRKLTAHCFLSMACSFTVFAQSCQSDKCPDAPVKKKHAWTTRHFLHTTRLETDTVCSLTYTFTYSICDRFHLKIPGRPTHWLGPWPYQHESLSRRVCAADITVQSETRPWQHGFFLSLPYQVIAAMRQCNSSAISNARGDHTST